MADEEPTLLMALKKRKESSVSGDKTEELLQMILEQVTKVADVFAPDEEPDNTKIVTTQESHSP